MINSRGFLGWAESPATIAVIRILTGAIFVVSGVAKGIDPWGFIFKIEEYLGIWGVELPRTVLLVGAIGLSAYEFIYGTLLSLGAIRRVAPRALMLTMAFMLPLTAYIAIANPVSDCGCFGDFLKMSNWATFVKNIVITGMLVYLWKYNTRVGLVAIRPSLQWLAELGCFAYILGVALFGYLVQPMIDFRDYKIGSMISGSDEAHDEGGEEIVFTYEKEGERREFTIDSLPDSTWTFVSRREPAGVAGDSSSLTVYDGDEDVTWDVIAEEGLQLLLTLPEPSSINIAYAYTVNELVKGTERAGGNAIGLIAGSEEAIDEWTDLSMAAYDCYSADDTTLKTLVRGSMGAVLLRDGEIVWKRSIASIDYTMLEKLNSGEIGIEDFGVDGSVFMKLTAGLALYLIVLSLCSHLFGGSGLRVCLKLKD